MGQFSNSFPKQFSYLCEYAIRFDLNCSFCEYPFIFHCLHCSPSCFDPDSLLLANLWLGLSCPKTSSRKPYTSSKQQERQKHSVETTIKISEDLEQKITTWQREVDLKLMKSVRGAHVRTPEEDDLSEECVCEPPRACLCCHRPPEMVEQDLLYAYQGLKDTTKGEESVEDHLPTSITQGASNLHSD